MILGEKIKELRLACGLTQEELADRCELTKGYISQLENELTSPSIATLKDILAALGSSLKDFFAEEEEVQVVFRKKDFCEKQADGVITKWLVPNAQKNSMEPVLVALQRGAPPCEDFPHEGEEFGYVLDGSVRIRIGNKKYLAKKGECFYYTASKTHSVENAGETDAKIIWISTPPNF